MPANCHQMHCILIRGFTIYCLQTIAKHTAYLFRINLCLQAITKQTEYLYEDLLMPVNYHQMYFIYI